MRIVGPDAMFGGIALARLAPIEDELRTRTLMTALYVGSILLVGHVLVGQTARRMS